MPDDNSLYGLLTKNETKLTQDGRFFHTTLDTLTQEHGLPLDRYKQVATSRYQHLSDETTKEILFDKKNDAQRTRCIGEISRPDFEKRFGEGLGLYEDNKEQLALVFMYTSFPETYMHPQIARVLRASNKLMNPDSAHTRIRDTALIMVQAMSGHCLATMALIAASHLMRNVKGKKEYNEDTVEFTLLTFSYYGAKRAAGVKEDDWFFYWKVFGSLMGLGSQRLHDNFVQAGDRLKELHKQCPSPPPSPDSRALLDAFIKSFDLKKNADELKQSGLMTKRMWDYLESQKVLRLRGG